MNRRDFLKVLGVSSLSVSSISCVTAGPDAKPAQRPNILFIFSDDHAVRSIGTYGSTINKTPNIDRIADEGIALDRCFCCNSICAPSRAAILTGKHSHANGLMTNLNTFDGSQMTFPKLLQKAGYQTALVGKWHLKTDPTGFDYWEILPGQGNYYNPDFRREGGKKRYTGYATDVTTDLTLDWLENKRDANKPFMMMCQHKAPHRVWTPGPKHLTMYDDVTIPEPETLFDDYANRNSALKDNEMEIGRHMMMDYDLKVAGSKVKDVLGRAFKNPELRRMTPEQRADWDAAYEPKNDAFRKAKPVLLEPVMDVLREKGDLPCMIHTNEPVGHPYPGKTPVTLDQILTLAKAFPENRIILAHWGGGIFFYHVMKKQLKDNLKNIWYDTAASPYLYDPQVYDMAFQAGVGDKVLFGTDYPLLPPSRYYKDLDGTGLTPEQREAVLGGNAQIFYA